MDRAGKKIVLDELCATTGWHRDHPRKTLRQSLALRAVKSKPPQPPLYGESVIDDVRFCWAVQGTLCRRLLAAALPDLVPRLRRLGELDVDDTAMAPLLKIAPATIDLRLKADRAKLDPRGRSDTKPGAPLRTCADWDDSRSGFVEIGLVAYETNNNRTRVLFHL